MSKSTPDERASAAGPTASEALAFGRTRRPPAVEQRPGESEFAARTRVIRENLGESTAKQYLVAEHLAEILENGISDGDTYYSFSDFVETKVPEIGVAWAYCLVNVFNTFEYRDIVAYSFSALNELIKLSSATLEFHNVVPPTSFLSNKHTFLDVNGRRITVNFPEQHSIAHLKALVAIARTAFIGKKEDRAPAKLSNAARALETAAKQAAASVEGATWSVRERRRKTKLELEADSTRISEVLTKTVELLAAAK